MTPEPSADDPDDGGDLGAHVIQGTRRIQNAADDRAQVAALCAQVLPRLIAFFLSRNCGADAEDLAQQVLERFVRHRHRYPHELIANVDAYLMRIAQRRFAEYVREERFERTWLIPLESPRDHEDRDDDELLSARAAERPEGAGFEMLDEELVGAIWDGVGDALDATDNPDLNRQIVRLAAMRYSYAEIATHLGVSAVRVRNVMSRMRQKLAQLHPEWAKDRRLPGPQRRRPADPDDGA